MVGVSFRLQKAVGRRLGVGRKGGHTSPKLSVPSDVKGSEKQEITTQEKADSGVAKELLIPEASPAKLGDGNMSDDGRSQLDGNRPVSFAKYCIRKGVTC